MNFRDLDIWRMAIDLANDIYKITKVCPRSETYGLSSQMQRASISISSNIAEGFKRSSKKEFSLFLSYARGSVGELESQLEIAKLQDYINDQQRNKLINTCDNLSKMIWSFRANPKNRSQITDYRSQ